MNESIIASILRSQVHFFIGTLFLASAAALAGLTIWQTATGDNPLANALVRTLPADVTF